MNEHGAAAARHARPRVVVDLDDEVVEIILAFQPIGIGMLWYLDWSVVVTIGGVLTPAVLRANPLRGL